MRHIFFTDDDIQPGASGAQPPPPPVTPVYPTSEDYDDPGERRESSSGSASWKKAVSEEPAPGAPKAPEPETVTAEVIEEKKEKSEKQRRRLKRLSDLAPKLLNYVNKEFAIPMHRDMVFAKFTKEQVSEYLHQVDNYNNGTDVVFTDATRAIQREIKNYEAKAILDDDDAQDVTECVQDLIDYYGQNDTQINPWLMLAITVGSIQIPVWAPIAVPKVKAWINGSPEKPALTETKAAA